MPRPKERENFNPMIHASRYYTPRVTSPTGPRAYTLEEQAIIDDGVARGLTATEIIQEYTDAGMSIRNADALRSKISHEKRRRHA